MTQTVGLMDIHINHRRPLHLLAPGNLTRDAFRLAGVPASRYASTVRAWAWLPAFWLLCVLGVAGILTFRWEIDWLDLRHLTWSGSELRELGEFSRLIGTAAVFPAVLLMVTLRLGLNRFHRLPAWGLGVVAVVGLAVSILGGLMPILETDQEHMARKRLRGLEDGLEEKVSTLCAAGRHAEAVNLMEEVLAAKEAVIAFDGLGFESCNHGYSYLFVTLHPAAQDLPRRMGRGLSWILYDRWHDGRWTGYDDPLVPALRQSEHPLLRGIGHWVAHDYEAFGSDMLGSAAAGDKRVETLALVAACLSDDRRGALRAVEPILDRGVGIGGSSGPTISATRIRDCLEGRVSPRDLRGYFTNPPQSR